MSQTQYPLRDVALINRVCMARRARDSARAGHRTVLKTYTRIYVRRSIFAPRIRSRLSATADTLRADPDRQPSFCACSHSSAARGRRGRTGEWHRERYTRSAASGGRARRHRRTPARARSSEGAHVAPASGMDGGAAAWSARCRNAVAARAVASTHLAEPIAAARSNRRCLVAASGWIISIGGHRLGSTIAFGRRLLVARSLAMRSMR